MKRFLTTYDSAGMPQMEYSGDEAQARKTWATLTGNGKRENAILWVQVLPDISAEVGRDDPINSVRHGESPESKFASTNCLDNAKEAL